MKMNFEETNYFQKDCRKLEKKYRSLPDDLDVFKNIISVMPLGNSRHFSILRRAGDIYIIKARLFCRYLRGSSLRVTHAYIEAERRISFLQLFFKGDRENEDMERIEEYLGAAK